MSAFLPLGPCGQGAFAIVQLSSVGRQALTASEFGHGSASGDTVYYISIVLGLMLWGLGLWWFWHGTFTVRAVLPTAPAFNRSVPVPWSDAVT